MNDVDIILPWKSSEIVEQFLASGKSIQRVETELSGRTTDSVYNALIGYLKRHPNLGLTVRKSKGDVLLVRNATYRNATQVH